MTTARVRKVALGPSSVTVIDEGEGRLLLKSPAPLSPYPTRLTERLLYWATRAPDRTFVAMRLPTGEWRRITYAHALEYARRIGQGLIDRGLSPERPLMILSENDLEHAMLALAALHAGVPFLAVSPAYSIVSQDHGKLKFVADLMTPGLVFASDGMRYERAIAATIPGATEVVITHGHIPGRSPTFFSELAATPPTRAVDEAHELITGDTISKFLLTSGSTGMPKAVIHTQRMITSNLQMINDSLPFLAEEPPVLVDWLPWNHTFGGNHNYGIALYNGGTLYIDEGKPVPQMIKETLRNLREIAPTVYFNVPRGFEEIAQALHADPALAKVFFSRVKMLFYAAASLAQPIWDSLHAAAEKACGERILMITGLGMTETAPFACVANWEAGQSGGIGHPAPGVELRLAPVGDKLEVRYRGPSVTRGFWRREQLTRESFDEDGFYRSGDAARFLDPSDPQKGLVFDGRIAEDFKLTSGTFVSVGPLRARIMAAGSPWVQDAVIAGHNCREVTALIIPRSGTPNTPALGGACRRILDSLAMDSTGSATRVARAVLLTAPLSIDAGEITDKGSINQQAVLKARTALVEDLYAEPSPPHIIHPTPGARP